MQWLAQLDATRPRYLGSTPWMKMPYARGGSGYLVSKPLLDAIGATEGLANSMEAHARTTCCGDFAFSLAVKRVAGIEVEQMVRCWLRPISS
jgi:hypothetical protein